jgi:hypothetical protein
MAKVLLKVKPATGDPAKPQMIGDVMIPAGKTKIDQGFDLRDRLAELAIMGNALKPDDKSAIYNGLVNQLGQKTAQKLMDHAFVFSSRPDVQRLSPEEKLKSFYTIGSNDPEVMGVIGQVKNLGYGVVPGYRESTSVLNQATQRGGVTQNAQNVNPEVTRRIMLRTNR